MSYRLFPVPCLTTPDPTRPRRPLTSLTPTLEETLVKMSYRLLLVLATPNLTTPRLAKPCPALPLTLGEGLLIILNRLFLAPRPTRPCQTPPNRAVPRLNTRRGTISNPLSAIKPMPRQTPPLLAVSNLIRPCLTFAYLTASCPASPCLTMYNLFLLSCDRDGIITGNSNQHNT